MELWNKRAACLGKPKKLFFPERTTDKDPGTLPDDYFETFDADDEAKAKEVCAVCPVPNECINDAVVMRTVNGIWGTGGDRRRRLRRLYLKWQATGSKTAKKVYLRAVQVEVDLLRGVHVRRRRPMRRCERCAKQGLTSWIPAGVHPEDRNGDGARCNFAVTYARGCRCYYCRLAHSQRFHRPKKVKVEKLINDTKDEGEWPKVTRARARAG